MTSMPINQIFISHTGNDSSFIDKLTETLRAAGHSIWIAEMDVEGGMVLMSRDQRTIDDCSQMIAVITPDYLSSDRCMNHFTRAQSLGKDIIAIVIEKPSQSQKECLQLQSIEIMEMCDWQQDAAFKQKTLKLARDLLPADEKALLDDLRFFVDKQVAELEAHDGVKEYIDLLVQKKDFELYKPMPATKLADGYWRLFPDSGVGSTLGALERSDEQTGAESIHKIVCEHDRFVLLGDPGSGKSTTLRHLAYEDALRWRQNPFTNPVPLLIDLSEWKKDLSPEEFILSHWQFSNNLRQLLKDGKVRLYIDALDRISVHQTQKVIKLNEWIHTYSPKYVIVSCRRNSYVGEFQLNLPRVLTLDLNEDQITKFSNCYLEERADEFLAIVLPSEGSVDNSGSPMLKLIRNPYLLGALIRLFEYSDIGKLPRNSGQLFRKLTKALWERELKRSKPEWCASNEIFEQKYQEMASALGSLAFGMIDEDILFIEEDLALKQLSGKYFWKDLDRESNLSGQALLTMASNASLIERQHGNLCFYHYPMQEYFAAFQLAKESSSGRLEFPPQMHVSLDDDGRLVFHRYAGKWDQVVIALCGIDDADAIISRLNQFNPYLSAQCIASGAVVSARVRIDTISILARSLEIPKTDDQKWTGAYILEAFQANLLESDASLKSGINECIRLWSAKGLTMIGIEAAGEILKLISEADTSIQIYARKALLDMGTDVLPYLIEAAMGTDSDSIYCSLITEALTAFYERQQTKCKEAWHQLPKEKLIFCLESVLESLIPAFKENDDPIQNWPDILAHSGVDLTKSEIISYISGQKPEAYSLLTEAYQQKASLYPERPDNYLRLIILNLIRNDISNAHRIYQEAIQLSAVDGDMHEEVGIWFCRLQQYEHASNAFRMAIETAPEKPRYRWFQGLIHMLAPDTGRRPEYLQSALKEFTAAISIEPSNHHIYAVRGLVCSLLGQYSNAIADMTHYIEGQPHDPEGYIYRADIYINADMPILAIEDLTRSAELIPDDATLIRKRSDLFLALQQFDRAIADSTRVIELHPDRFEAYNYRGIVYLHNQKNKAAVADFSQAIKLEPQNPVLFGNRSEAYTRLELYERALNDLQTASQLDPDEIDYCSRRVQLYKRMEDMEAALADIAHAASSHLDNLTFLGNLPRLYKILSRPAQALEHISTLVEMHPDRAGLYYARGILHQLEMSNAQKALENFNKAIDLHPNSSELLKIRSDLFLGLENYEAAILDLDRIIEFEPQNVGAFNSRGIANLDAENYRIAANDFSRAIQLDNRDPVLYFNLGIAHLKMKQYQQAIDDFQNAWQRDPKNFLYASMRIQSYILMGDSDSCLAEIYKVITDNLEDLSFLSETPKLYEAIGELEQAPDHVSGHIAAHPESGGAYFLRGLIHHIGKEDLESALDDYNQAIKLAPHSPVLYKRRLDIYLQIKRYDEAISDLSRIIELEPASYEAYKDRGTVYLHTGKYKAAVADFNRAVQLAPDNPESYANRAEAYRRLGLYQKALHDFKSASQIDPDFFDYYSIRMQLYSHMEDTDSALADIGQIVSSNIHNFNLLSNIYLLYQAIGALYRAPEHISALMAKQPNSAGFHFVKGVVYHLGLGEPHKAIEDYTAGINLDGNIMLLYKYRAFAYLAIEEYGRALEDVTYAIAIGPDLSNLFSLKGHLHYLSGDPKSASEDYAEAIKSNKDDLNLYYQKAVYDQYLQQYDEAIKCCEDALLRDPNNPKLHILAGHIYVDQEDFEKAIISYSTAIKKDSQSSDGFYFRGLAYVDVGDYDTGLDNLLKSLSLESSDNTRACYSEMWCSVIYQLRDEKTRSNTLFDKVETVANEIEDPVERHLLLSLSALLVGDVDSARNNCKKIFEKTPSAYGITMQRRYFRRFGRLFPQKIEIQHLIEWFEGQMRKM